MNVKTYIWNKSTLLKNAEYLPEVPCVYYVVHKGCLLYIGRAKNLKERWTGNYGHGEHHKLWIWKRRGINIDRLRLYYWQRPKWRLEHDEAIEIRKFKPPDNGRFEPTNPFITLLDLLANVGFCVAIAFVVSQLVR